MPAFDHAFDWTRRHVASGALPTAVLGVADASGVIAIEAFGEASADDHYPLFSITKPLVGLAALELVEQGRLAPTTTLGAALPGFRRAEEVQLRHLVSHSSGILESPMDQPELRRTLLAADSDFAPGTATRYSTLAFEGVAALIEHASGEPWEGRVLELARRAGADGVTFDRESTRHAPVDAAAFGLDWDRFSTLRHPGAGAFARASDLLALGSALLRNDGRVVSPAAVEAMRRPLTEGLRKLEPFTEDRGQEWGFAWNLLVRAPGLLARDTYGHAGWAGTQFWITPSRDVCVVLLTNRPDPAQFGIVIDELQNAVVSAASRRALG